MSNPIDGTKLSRAGMISTIIVAILGVVIILISLVSLYQSKVAPFVKNWSLITKVVEHPGPHRALADEIDQEQKAIDQTKPTLKDQASTPGSN